MTVEEVEEVVHLCSKIEWPRELRHGKPATEDEESRPLRPAEKVDCLEDFMLLCAEARNRCENGRIVIAEALRTLREQWDGIEGWESFLPGGKRRKEATRDDIDEAKSEINGDLLPSIRKAEFLLRRLDQQISRFAKNEETVSRLYTIATS